MVAINLIGNSLVCLVVLKDKTMRTPMNFLLVNLAVSDIIVGIFSTFRLACELRRISLVLDRHEHLRYIVHTRPE